MRGLAALGLLLGTVVLGCRSDPGGRASMPPSGIRLENVASAAGIDFTLGEDSRPPRTVLQTAPGGAAFLDYDRDGHLDALLVGPQRVGLYRNLGQGRFENVTARSGLQGDGHWMGCSVADYDGDQWVDLLLTGYGRTTVFRNREGRFEDATRASGVVVPGWTLSAAFADYDLDGRLDLYVTRYLEFDARSPQLCRLGSIKTACGPEVYEPQRGMLFHNEGGGRFREVTRTAGLAGAHGKAWTALFSDFNGDRFPDLYIANDMTPCDFFLNRQGRFEEAGSAGSVAYDGNGHLLGAMGADSGDYDRDGDYDLLVTTFFAQATCLYRNDGQALFTELGTRAGLGAPTIPFVGFGTGLWDLDNDGWLDMFVASGHVRDNVKEHDAGQDYAQPMQVFSGSDGRFTEASAAAGLARSWRIVGRGAAFGDYDSDGRVDILVCNLNGSAVLLRNVSPTNNHWLGVRLRGSRNSQGLGSRVTIEQGGRRQVREVRTCGSVMSANDPSAHFGLGTSADPVQVMVEWPEGGRSSVSVSALDQLIDVRQPQSR